MEVSFNTPLFPSADPFLLTYDNKYYLYSTSENDRPLLVSNAFDTDIDGQDGIQVYESADLIHWENKGFCLKKGDVIGEKWFWAPEVTYYRGKFYMIYIAEEHLAVAVADNPLGPFKQEEKRWLREGKSLDGHIFFDDDGKIYFYYVRIGGGNRIYVARLSEDLLRIEEEYEDCLIEAAEPWETMDRCVAEGPFMLKHKGVYYLSYSCNHTRSKDYAIGYATATCPTGPFTKFEGNPILSRKQGVEGVGHHSFRYDLSGKQLLCAYHCHNPGAENFKPRHFCLAKAEFVVQENGPDILRINGR